MAEFRGVGSASAPSYIPQESNQSKSANSEAETKADHEKSSAQPSDGGSFRRIYHLLTSESSQSLVFREKNYAVKAGTYWSEASRTLKDRQQVFNILQVLEPIFKEISKTADFCNKSYELAEGHLVAFYVNPLDRLGLEWVLAELAMHNCTDQKILDYRRVILKKLPQDIRDDILNNSKLESMKIS